MAKQIESIFYALLPALLFAGCWEFVVFDSPRLNFLFGSPSAILVRAANDYCNSRIWLDIGITAFEAVSGLFLGSALGIVVAIIIWANPWSQKVVRIYLSLIGSIPIFALAPILIIWFGVGLLPKILMAAFGVFIVSIVHTYRGISSTAEQHISFARTLGASQLDIIKKLLLPSACHWLITALQINVGIALLGAFIGEFVSSQAGLGHYIIEAGQLYDMPGVLFGVINLSLLALVLDALFGRLILICYRHSRSANAEKETLQLA